jgi:Bacterial regulatory proteins, lacI family
MSAAVSSSRKTRTEERFRVCKVGSPNIGFLKLIVRSSNCTKFQRYLNRMKKSMTTIREVAKESRFSTTTVSFVLNNAPLARYIPEATKERIEEVAKKLGYRPNLFARSLGSKRSQGSNTEPGSRPGWKK